MKPGPAGEGSWAETVAVRSIAGVAPQRARRLVWAGVLCMMGLSLLSIVSLALLEVGPWRQEVIAVDELYFAACAARGLAVGQVAIAGCHDNKGPVIVLVHQLVHWASAGYDLLAIKAAAFATVVLVIGLVARLAFRLGGLLAAAVAAALALQSFASDATHMALKTETVGIACVLLALLVLVPKCPQGPQGSRLLSGLLMGLAVLTKQTNFVLVLPVLLWFASSARSAPGGWVLAFLADASRFAIGMAMPLVLFMLFNHAGGRPAELLGGLLVYPSVYGMASDVPPLLRLAWQLGAMSAVLAKTPLLVALFAAAAATGGQPAFGGVKPVGEDSRARWLVLAVAVALLVAAVASPSFYAYHVVPPRVLMAVLGGVLIADLAARFGAAHAPAAAALAAVLVASSLLMALNSWYSNAGKGRVPPAPDARMLVEDGRGEYAYVLGMWPDFYVRNGLIPASNVMYPWALAGAPANNFYSLPPPKSARGRLLGWARQQGLQRLMEDFEQTPPRYIVVVDRLARGSDSSRTSDVPGFDEYLRDRCRPLRQVEAGNQGSGSLFRCQTKRFSSTSQPGDRRAP